MLTIRVLVDGELVPVSLEPVGVTRDDRAVMYAELFGDGE